MNPPRGNGAGRTLSLAVLTLGCALAVLSAPARAERLPIRTYGVRDGLAHSRVNSVFQDARGYLWICTWEGISRADGSAFVNYGAGDGLTGTLVNGVAADPAGRLWFATHSEGIARLEEHRADMSAPKFTMFRVDTSRTSNVVYGLFFAADGTLWCSTGAGIYRARIGEAGVPAFERWRVLRGGAVAFPLDAARRTIGVVDSVSFLRVTARGEEAWPLIVPMRNIDNSAVGPDGEGGILLGVSGALYQFSPPPPASEAATPAARGAAGRWRRLTLPISADRYVTAIHRDSIGVLWIGTRDGLIKAAPGDTVRYTRAEGLSDTWIRCISEDRDGNLWVGTHAGGLDRLGRQGILRFSLTEGLLDANVARIVEAHDGRLYASTARGGVVEIRGRELRQVPGSTQPPFNRIFQHILQDRAGDWWVGADAGLWKFEGPELQLSRGRRFGPADGIPDSVAVFGDLHEDAAGRIWFGAFDHVLWCHDPARTPPFRAIDLDAAAGAGAPREMIDGPGGILLAPFVGLWRLEQGRITPYAPDYSPAPGVAPRDVSSRCLELDQRGWLWIGYRFSGVSVTRDPWAPEPSFRNYSTRDGLASDAVWAIAEDRAGRMYFGTSRGIDRLDPDTGRIRHLGPVDGLPGDVVNALKRDANGRIWVGSSGGISRLDPDLMHAPAEAPPIYVTRVEAGGEPLPVPETGTTRAGEYTLPATRNNILIEFAGIDFRGPELRYQWMLAGVDRAWSAPMDLRHVQYARLAAGRYRFMVRAVNGEGTLSSEPAVVLFRVLRPFYAQPWFVALLAAVAVAVAWAFHRARVQRVLALERIRRQIATDLHDDVGSGLSQIAVLSEVGKRAAADPGLRGTLDEVATLARDMRDSMSDIVWSVDPRKDRLSDLVQRMRQVSLNLLESAGVTVVFTAPPDREFERVNLSPDRRRHIHLIFKEAATNIARHAAASQARITLQVSGGALDLVIEDDGHGLAEAGPRNEGQGLASMRDRARALGGRLDIVTTPGRGTRVSLRVPLR